MIYLIFAAVGILLAFYIGVWYTESKYEKVLIEYKELQEKDVAWSRHCKALREQYQKALMAEREKREKIVLERTHENEPCIFVEKEKYRNVTVVVGECKKCGRTDISWYRQEDTEEVEVE